MANPLLGEDELIEVAQAIIWRWVDGNLKDSVLEGWFDRAIAQTDVDEFLKKWGPTIEHFGSTLLLWIADMDEVREYQEEIAQSSTCRPSLSHIKPCGPTDVEDECACHCRGDDYWCGEEA